ncbi:MAG: ester cyclase [Haloarculaceae archaeon]
MADPGRQNERTIRQLFDEVVNGQQYDRIPRYCAPEVMMHRPGDVVIEGREAYANHYQELHAAFPDFETARTDVVADSDRVATRFVVTGTHEGELLGLEPTGTQVRFSAQVLFRLADGTVTAEFHQSDRTSLREQLREE